MIDVSSLDKNFGMQFASTCSLGIMSIFALFFILTVLFILYRNDDAKSKIYKRIEGIAAVIAFISLFMFIIFGLIGLFITPQAYENKTYHFDTGRVVEYKLNSLSHHEYVYKVYKYIPNTGFMRKKFQYKYISKDRVIPNKDVIK